MANNLEVKTLRERMETKEEWFSPEQLDSNEYIILAHGEDKSVSLISCSIATFASLVIDAVKHMVGQVRAELGDFGGAMVATGIIKAITDSVSDVYSKDSEDSE